LFPPPTLSLWGDNLAHWPLSAARQNVFHKVLRPSPDPLSYRVLSYQQVEQLTQKRQTMELGYSLTLDFSILYLDKNPNLYFW
jgi:hypothetical protein